MVTSSYTTHVDTPKALSVATLIIFVVLLQPLLIIFYKHGLRSWLAWLPLQSLCILRIIGSALQLHADKTHKFSSSAQLVNNIGLAPLLLGTLGILHEARAARNPNLRQRREWIMVIQFHAAIITATILVIIGVLKITGAHPKQSDTAFPKIGTVMIILGWACLVAWTAASFRFSQYDKNVPAYRNGTKLLYGVAIAMPFLGVRDAYALLSNFVTSEKFLTSLAVKVSLGVVPEMIAVLIFVHVGLATRTIWEEMNQQKKVDGRVLQDSK